SSGVDFADNISVPGAWIVQGFGEDTPKLRNSYHGVAWYKKEAAIPEDWNGKRLFVFFDGVYRSAHVWVNGNDLGEHIGYSSGFEYEISDLVASGSSALIAVRVESRRNAEIDGLVGCFDMIDTDLIPRERSDDGVLGGIWGHVKLESRRDGWLENIFVQTNISTKECVVSADVLGEIPLGAKVKAVIKDNNGVTLAEAIKNIDGDSGKVYLDVSVPEAELWTIELPTLYTAGLSLVVESESVYSIESRFGFRSFEIRGRNFYLNENEVYLRGYGDD
ncbi:unnamed protein product, partial [marine sediment metagenome]